MKTRMIFIALFAMIPFTGILAQRLEKKLEKSFAADKNTILQVESKFGEVRILPSETGKIEVLALMWVEGKSEKQSADLLSALDAKISFEANTVSVKSVIPESIGNRNNVQYQVDFTIKAPSHTSMVVVSKYGSVFLGDMSGLLDLNIAYGSLQAQTLSRKNEKPLSQIKLAYSSGNIDKAGWLKTDLAYSKLNVGESDALVVVSKYSVLSLDECSSVVSQSKYDTYKAGVLNNYSGTHSYCNIRIGELKKQLDINNSYTNLKIDFIPEEFEKLNIENLRGNARLVISDKASFNFSGEAIRGEITIPGIDKLNKRQENADKFLEGKHGETPAAVVTVKSTEGAVTIELD